MHVNCKHKNEKSNLYIINDIKDLYQALYITDLCATCNSKRNITQRSWQLWHITQSNMMKFYLTMERPIWMYGYAALYFFLWNIHILEKIESKYQIALSKWKYHMKFKLIPEAIVPQTPSPSRFQWKLLDNCSIRKQTVRHRREPNPPARKWKSGRLLKKLRCFEMAKFIMDTSSQCRTKQKVAH